MLGKLYFLISPLATERDEARTLSRVVPVLELAFARQVASTDVNALYEQLARVSDLCTQTVGRTYPRARFLTSAISHRFTGQATPMYPSDATA